MQTIIGYKEIREIVRNKLVSVSKTCLHSSMVENGQEIL